jgi:predicted RNase H-like nuclease (RuvC/YqgF family)
MTKEELQKQVNRLLKEIVELNELNDKQDDKIKELKQQLKESKQNTYIHETHHLYCQDGELHIYYGDVENDNLLVWNTDSLFKDLPFIINQVVKQNKKMQKMYLNNIKEELKEM